MKVQATSYTFNAVAKTVTFSGLVPASLESILHVANVTTGTLLFQPQGGALLTGTWSSPVLTLACSTAGMANGDRLLIFVEDGAATVPTTISSTPFVRTGFAEVGSGIVGKAADEFTLLQTGSGMAVNQSGGNLVITTGTTVNAETVIRSIKTFSGSLMTRFKVILSQRIANQTFRYELADLVGSALSYTINSATSVTVTFPATNPFTAASVGQSVRLSLITGAAGIPGRYAIASVSGLTVTFTVAAWPASGSGTLTLYGWNHVQLEYSGTTATTASFDAQRRGWNSGNTAATINTTASPGHVAQIAYDVQTAGLSDSLVASNTGYQWLNRASRVENVYDPDVLMYLFIVVQNGSTAPASTTTLTTGFLQVEDQGRQKVRIASSDPVGSHALPVQVLGGNLGTQAVSGTVTANQGTMAALAAGTNAIGDVGVQYRASATGASSFANVNCPATPAVQSIKAAAGRLVGLVITNTNAAARYLKVWNTASGSITLGTTAALFEVALPTNQPVTITFEGGLAFTTAINVAVTAGQGLTNNGAVTLGDVTGLIAFA